MAVLVLIGYSGALAATSVADGVRLGLHLASGHGALGAFADAFLWGADDDGAEHAHAEHAHAEHAHEEGPSGHSHDGAAPTPGAPAHSDEADAPHEHGGIVHTHTGSSDEPPPVLPTLDIAKHVLAVCEGVLPRPASRASALADAAPVQSRPSDTAEGPPPRRA